MPKTLRTRERVAKALSHETPDRVPFDATGTRGLVGLAEGLDLSPLEEQLYAEGDFEYVHIGVPAPSGEALAAYIPEVPEGADVSLWGVPTRALKSVEGYHAGHQYVHPLARVDAPGDLEDYPWPDFADPSHSPDLAEGVAEAKRSEYWVVGDMSQTILETAYILRGLEQMMADFHERPAYVHALFGKLGELRVAQATRLAEAGIDVLRIGDDIATQEALMISPGMYREFIGPHHAASVDAARRINPQIGVLYHSDGKLDELLPDLIEVGVTAINPAQPECMDLPSLKREFGRDLTFWGCMPVQSLFEYGTGGDIERYLRGLVDEVGTDGGLVVHFINMIVTPRVEANMRAFFASFHQVARC